MSALSDEPPPWPGVRPQLPRVLATRDAARIGYSRAAFRHAIARGWWQRLVPGVVLTVPGEPTRTDWACVGLSAAGPGSAVSGWDAVRLAGLGSPHPPSAQVLVLATGGRHRVAGQVRIRPTRRQFVAAPTPTSHAGRGMVPVVHIARAVADTALEYRRLEPVRALTTSTIQRGLCTPADLVAELDQGPRNRSALLRRALADVLDGARSIAEAEAADALRSAPVPSFELNVAIVDRSGAVHAVVDLLWRELRAVAEIDSREYHFSELDWKRTSRRHNILTTAGFAVQHFTPSEIRSDPGRWAADVVTWLRARAVELGIEYAAGDGPRRAGQDGPEPFVLP